MNIKLTDTSGDKLAINSRNPTNTQAESYYFNVASERQYNSSNNGMTSITVYVSKKNLRKIALAILSDLRESDLEPEDGVLEVNGERI